VPTLTDTAEQPERRCRSRQARVERRPNTGSADQPGALTRGALTHGDRAAASSSRRGARNGPDSHAERGPGHRATPAKRAVRSIPAQPVPTEPIKAEPIKAEPLPADVATLEESIVAELDQVADTYEPAHTPDPANATKRVSRRRLWTAIIAVAMLAVAIITLRGHLPSAGDVTIALRTGDPIWVVVAAVCEAISLGMFARQQRSILGALSVRMSLPRAIAVTYARSALAISMPAGSAVSAGFAFQQYRRSGASREQAAAVTVLSGLISFFGLAALYIGGALTLVAMRPTQTWHAHPTLVITTAAGLLVGTAIGITAHRRGKAHANDPDHYVTTATGSVPLTATRPRPAPAATAAVTPAAAPARIVPTTTADPDAAWRRRTAAIRAGLHESVTAWRTLRARHWTGAGTFALINWLTDMLCLAAAARAFNLPVGLVEIAGIYLGVQLLRQIPLTPGGIGLIETGLLAGLTAAGAPGAGAAAAVLTYRLLSCWLILPLGGLAALALRKPPAGVALGSAPTEATAPVT
jgi:uncharacterized membrane protein YbhN (UPF0104 family)